MEILKGFKLIAATFSQTWEDGSLELEINGQRCVYSVQVYENGLCAFDFPEELRLILRQHPRVSHLLMETIIRLRKNQTVRLPVDMLEASVAEELQAA